MPDLYWILQSNAFDEDDEDEQYLLRDPHCSNGAMDGGSESGTLLTCTGPSSVLFDGVIGQDRPEHTELLQYYTWQQEFTPRPYISMSFDPPLVELPNITLYFYQRGDIRAPLITMCFSRFLNYTPCDNIELSERQRIRDGVVVWPVMLPTDVTSVTFLRIDMEHEDDDEEDDYIFLSEIRVAERLQGFVVTCTVIIVYYIK